MKTRGIFYVAPKRIELREFEIGDPDLFEVQIDVKATGICAWDLSLYKGHMHEGASFPLLHGHEGAGIVTKVGARVTQFKVGDKVAAMGDDSALMANVANVPVHCVSKLTDDVEDWQNWIAEPVACVMNGLEWCKIIPGDRIAVVGTGFMGLMFVQVLNYAPVLEVIAMDVDEVRLQMAKDFGADQVINLATPQGQDAVKYLEANPVDIAVECAGNQAAVQTAYKILRKAGRLNIFSAQRGEPRQIDLSTWHNKGFEAYASSPSISPNFAKIYARTVPMMQKGVFDLKSLITHTSSPEEAPELFEIANNKTDGYIKGVILW